MRFFWLALLVLYPVSASAERLLDLGEIRFNHNSGSQYNGSFSEAPAGGWTYGRTRILSSSLAVGWSSASEVTDHCGAVTDLIGDQPTQDCIDDCTARWGGSMCLGPSGWSTTAEHCAGLEREYYMQSTSSCFTVGSGSCTVTCVWEEGGMERPSSIQAYYEWSGVDDGNACAMNPETGGCEAGENPGGGSCPEGTVEQTFVTNGETRSHCGPDLNPENQNNCMFNPDGSMFCDGDSGEPEQGCNDPLSIYEGNSICASDKNACTRAGGTFGFAGSGAEMNGICIPFDDAEQIPTCSDLSAPIQSSDGSWRCLYASELDINDGWLTDPNINPNFNPDDLDGDGVPNSLDETPNGGYIIPGRPPSDIDGDGIPDLEDGDMDGDGINNGSDDDSDGDGILNEDDPTPDGDLDEGTDDEIEEEEEENEVSGGASCDAAPTCSGDDSSCFIVIQSWKTRCALEGLADGLTEEINEGADGGLGEANTASNSLIDTFEQTALASLGESSGLVAADGLGDSLSTALGFSYSCQDWVFSYQSINASITCADTAPLRSLLSWAFGLFTLIAVFQIATRSPE